MKIHEYQGKDILRQFGVPQVDIGCGGVEAQLDPQRDPRRLRFC